MWNDIRSYVRKNIPLSLALLSCGAISFMAFMLYQFPMEPVAYACSLSLFILSIYFIIDFTRFQKRLLSLRAVQAHTETQNLPQDNEPIGDAYLGIIRMMEKDLAQAISQMDQKKSDTLDYFTLWMHQIKTPIAAMHMLLKPEDEAMHLELLKAERYVEMALGFLRLDSITSDLAFHPCDLDSVVKQTLRKFAPFFVYTGISLEYSPIHHSVITDEKWLAFVLEQILSNALKYTKQGSIAITLEEPDTLIIRDTGIGIRAEDVPRVFERGFTGYNGRMDKKSTGLGLYLCGQIMKRLSHGITVESIPGEGTAVRLDLSSVDLRYE